jgi:hypothetical protein
MTPGDADTTEMFYSNQSTIPLVVVYLLWMLLGYV